MAIEDVEVHLNTSWQETFTSVWIMTLTFTGLSDFERTQNRLIVLPYSHQTHIQSYKAERRGSAGEVQLRTSFSLEQAFEYSGNVTHVFFILY